jgi:insulysin
MVSQQKMNYHILTDYNRLYADLVTDSLTEFSYDAALAGMEYQFVSQPSGLFIRTSGYNDKLARLTQHILTNSKSLVVDPARLAVIKEEVGNDNGSNSRKY